MESKFKIGEKVMHLDEEWEVIYVIEEERKVILIRIGVEEEDSAFRVDPVCAMVDADEVVAKPHELTAAEYAEKLRTYFGKPEIGELDITISFCSERGCKGCAFDNGLNCMAAVVMFDPERALQMIQEAENRDKAKGKTYLEDLREKMPNATFKYGIPDTCRKRLYNGLGEMCHDGIEACRKCWNEVMPNEEQK